MKKITVRIRDDDYEFLISRAKEIIEKFAQAGTQLSFTPEELIRKSLQDRALRAIGDGITAGFAEAESLMKKAVKK